MAGFDAMNLKAVSLVRFEVASRRQALPDTNVDLAWIDERIDVIGPMSVGRVSRYAIGTRVVLMSLDPVSASRWLGAPLELLRDRVVDLRDLDVGLFSPLAEQFAADRVADLVIPSGTAPRRPVSRDERAVALLAQGVGVAHVAHAVNLGERQFTRWFHRLTGLHPKRFQRVTRLRRALIAAKDGGTLAQVAAASGYTDQAHFNREVKALTGSVPREILPNVGNVQYIRNAQPDDGGRDEFDAA